MEIQPLFDNLLTLLNDFFLEYEFVHECPMELYPPDCLHSVLPDINLYIE